MSYAHLLVDMDRDAHIATVTLNKPEKLNAIDGQDTLDIVDLCRTLTDDDDIWVVIWTGAGRGFCSGADLGGRPAEQNRPRDPGLNDLLSEDSWISRQARALYGIDKPMIAAVNGVAAGAGFSLSLCCDLRVGTSNARFVTVFQERSLPPEGGMSFLLARTCGLSRAMDLCLTSRRVDAEEAYRIGLLDRIVEPDALMETARGLALRMCELPPAAVRVSKRAVRRGLEATFESSLLLENRYGPLATAAKEDREESLRAFTEKRKPKYKGR